MQTWQQTAVTPLHELTADCSLATLVSSTEIAQQSPISEIFLYALVFDEVGRVLLQPRQSNPFAPEMNVEGIVTVPHRGMDLVFGADDPGMKLRIRDAVELFLREEHNIACNPESVYLTQAKLPMRNGFTVAAVVRLEIFGSLPDHETLGKGEWCTREQVEQLSEAELHPAGLKLLLLEAFEQKQFEDEMLVGWE